MASQVAVNHPPQGNCRFDPCPWCAISPRRAERAQPSEGRAGSSNLPGETSLVRYASGKRGGCLPPKAGSIPVRTAIALHDGAAALGWARLLKGFAAMEKHPKQAASTVAKARQVARVLADALKESQRPGGYITLDQAFRELDERERRESAESSSRPRRKRTARRS